MAIDYSIKGKGNDRKTLNVINEYQYNSKGQILVNPWDSDVDYLYTHAIKFRGQIDATTKKVYHKTVKPGDLYITTKAGAVLDDSDWRNLRLKSINVGEALLFMDSDWTILGAQGSDKDSDQIMTVDTIAAFTKSYQRKLNRLHYAKTTDTLFFEQDSDKIFIFETQSLNGDDVNLIEGVRIGATKTIVVTFNGLDSDSGIGTIKYVPGNDSDSEQKITQIQNPEFPTKENFTVADNNVHWSIQGKDSDDQVAHITVANFPVPGDEIRYVSPNKKLSVLRTEDGINFRRVSKDRIAHDDLDSDFRYFYDDSKATKTIKVVYPGITIAAGSYDIYVDSDYHPLSITKNSAQGNGGGWYTSSDTNMVFIVVNDEVVHSFSGITALTATAPNGARYSRFAFAGTVAELYVENVQQTNGFDSYDLRILADGQHKMYVSETATDSRAEFDSDIVQNFTRVANHITQIDSELHIFMDKDVVADSIQMYGKFIEAVSKGEAIMFAGSQGNHLLFRKADLSIPGFRDEWIIGLADANYAKNAFGNVITQGMIESVDTSMFAAGNILYIDNDTNNPGRLLDSEPSSPLHSIVIAAVAKSHATQGKIVVRPTFGKSHIGDLHDVSIVDPAEGKKDNQFIMWDSDTDLWRNRTLNTDYGEF